ncbi:MarR family winged helix-turn-helix transcriptional regulator [Yinghuangia seranimata]|uniref:MarR family winged helix-turn-helix transcriptional regulator n=1 Tax=Yinghuangia seranimata TaxID=408067 RepID=UPI00248D15A7|nr:MarR family transcriptional regulator [Yinghuangia seranimata]MDI2125199.1 MarR family transcriptional regulator [Yinghuangia seranimata]
MPDPAATRPGPPTPPPDPDVPAGRGASDGPDGVDFLSFVDFAVRRAAARQPGIDTHALRMVLLLNRVSNVVTYDMESAVHRPHGWTWSGFRLLNVLWLAGPTEGKRIAEMSGMSRAAISSLANTLEKQGLVAREPSAHDGRAVTLRLTAQGEAALADTYREQNARERRWADALTPDERETLTALLGKIAQHAATRDWVRRRD